MPTPKKTTFIILITVTVLLLIAIATGLYLIPYVGLKNIHPFAPQIVLTIMAVVLGVLVLGVGLLVLTLVRGKEIIFASGLRGVVVSALFPVMILVGRLFGISQEKVQQSFIEVNNLLVRAKCLDKKPKRIMLLMPHCIQFSDCEIKITIDAHKCRACGKCRIGELEALSQKYGVDLSVATGGTLARRKISEIRPEAIIAVACERDLTSGIQDAYPLPVIGILNDRPFGPCYNTTVDIQKVADALEFFASCPVKG